MLHIHVTGGYTGKANSCVEAWVPTVSIHRPLSFYDFLKSRKKIIISRLDQFCVEKECVPGMEVPVVGHNEAGGEDDHNQDQQVEAQEHLLHSWSRKDS